MHISNKTKTLATKGTTTMSHQNLEFAPVTVEEVATWERERSSEELHSLLGRRMAAIAVDNIDAADDDEGVDAGLFDLMTV